MLVSFQYYMEEGGFPSIKITGELTGHAAQFRGEAAPSRPLAARRTHDLGQRGLAALARTLNQHDRRFLKRLGQAQLGVAGVERGVGHRLIVNPSPSN